MIAIGLSIVYFKFMYFGTFMSLIVIDYKYDLMKIMEKIPLKKCVDFENNISNKYAKSILSFIHINSIKIGQFSMTHIIDKTNLLLTKCNINKKITLCPHKIAKSMINSSIICKLLIPVFVLSSYHYANKTVIKYHNGKNK